MTGVGVVAGAGPGAVSVAVAGTVVGAVAGAVAATAAGSHTPTRDVDSTAAALTWLKITGGSEDFKSRQLDGRRARARAAREVRACDGALPRGRPSSQSRAATSTPGRASPAAAGHHISEGRWLRDRSYNDGLVRFAAHAYDGRAEDVDAALGALDRACPTDEEVSGVLISSFVLSHFHVVSLLSHVRAQVMRLLHITADDEIAYVDIALINLGAECAARVEDGDDYLGEDDVNIHIERAAHRQLCIHRVPDPTSYLLPSHGYPRTYTSLSSCCGEAIHREHSCP